MTPLGLRIVFTFPDGETPDLSYSPSLRVVMKDGSIIYAMETGGQWGDQGPEVTSSYRLGQPADLNEVDYLEFADGTLFYITLP